MPSGRRRRTGNQAEASAALFDHSANLFGY